MMSQDEKDSKINQMAIDLSGIKRWWPYLAGACTVLGVAITLAMRVQSAYDNDIAKTSDLKPILAKMEILSTQVKVLTDAFDNYKAADVSYKNNDMLERSAYKKELNDHIRYANRQFEHLNKTIAFYTENYSFDANGKRTIRVIPLTKSN